MTKSPRLRACQADGLKHFGDKESLFRAIALSSCAGGRGRCGRGSPPVAEAGTWFEAALRELARSYLDRRGAAEVLDAGNR